MAASDWPNVIDAAKNLSFGGGQQQQQSIDYKKQAQLLFPWIPAELVAVFSSAWAKWGDANLAMAALRQDKRYDTYFAGNKRPDGTVYLNEAEYLSTMEGYNRRLQMFGLNDADFTQQKIQALQYGRSADEMEADLASVSQQILMQGPTIRDWYAAQGFSSDISDQAILASVLNPGVPPQEYEHRYRMAQVGGTASSYGFSIGRSQAERLTGLGLDQAQATQLYSRAAAELPTLQELVQRHNDPDDNFTLDDYTDAMVIHDPKQMQTIGRLLAEEHSLFSGGGLLATDRSGGVAGLYAR